MEQSEEWADRIDEALAFNFGSQRIERPKDMGRQRRGFDRILHMRNNSVITIDLKKRNPKYVEHYDKDIAVETGHEFATGLKEGWVWKVECQFILYYWTDVDSSGKRILLPIAYQNDMANFRPWFERVCLEYETPSTYGSKSKSGNWVTFNAFVPVADIPSKCLIRLIL